MKMIIAFQKLNICSFCDFDKERMTDSFLTRDVMILALKVFIFVSSEQMWSLFVIVSAREELVFLKLRPIEGIV